MNLKEIKRESESLLQKMKGGAYTPLQVQTTEKVCFAGSHHDKTLFIHPLLLLEPKKIDSSAYKMTSPKILNSFKALWEYPKEFKEIRRFILAHEMAHISLHHQMSTWDRKLIVVLTLTSAYFNFFLVIPVYFVSRAILSTARKYSERYQEYEADRLALFHTKNFGAAKRFFLTMEKLGFRTPSHPNPLDRIKHLEQYA